LDEAALRRQFDIMTGKPLSLPSFSAFRPG
jgi:hypothetical protein